MEPITVIMLLKTKNEIYDKLNSIVKNINPRQILVGVFDAIHIDFINTMTIELKKDLKFNEALNNLQSLSTTDWIIYLKENENILEFDEYVPNLLSNVKNIYGFQILQDNVILKETRMWNKKEYKSLFKNPIFEKINLDSTKILNIILYEEKNVEDQGGNIDLWKKTNPLSVDAYYYKAFDDLAKKRFKEFKKNINYYLFNVNKNDIPSIMSRYYLALVQGIAEDDIKNAISNLMICIAENPLMAEFWCLLGDIFLKIDKYKEAIEFYENAKILGSRRQQLDFWPMHIPKYEEYPTEMIEKCKKTIASIKKYESNSV